MLLYFFLIGLSWPVSINFNAFYYFFIHFMYLSFYLMITLGCTTPSLSQSMYFTGTNSTMLPLSDAMTMGVSTRQTPTLWQYPSKYISFYHTFFSPFNEIQFFWRTNNASRKQFFFIFFPLAVTLLLMQECIKVPIPAVIPQNTIADVAQNFL